MLKNRSSSVLVVIPSSSVLVPLWYDHTFQWSEVAALFLQLTRGFAGPYWDWTMRSNPSKIWREQSCNFTKCQPIWCDPRSTRLGIGQWQYHHWINFYRWWCSSKVRCNTAGNTYSTFFCALKYQEPTLPNGFWPSKRYILLLLLESSVLTNSKREVC